MAATTNSSSSNEAILAAATMMQRFTCRLCGSDAESGALSLGPVPVCNRFATAPGQAPRVDLDLVQCAACQLVQLRQAPPPDLLTPRHGWIRYREPEAHLDAVAEAVLAEMPRAENVLGTGPFDAPLLARLGDRGLSVRSLTLDAPAAPGLHPYLESWQALLDPQRLPADARYDLVCSRYIVEHTPSPVQALQALRPLLAPGGLVLLEVPDSSTFLAACDYSFPWEEHASYFVEATLERLAAVAGFELRRLLRFPGALEDALVALLAVSPAPAPRLSCGGTAAFRAYGEGFSARRARIVQQIDAWAGPARDGVALFGLGHQAIMFANAHGVAPQIALAVDDDPDKQGFFPPGFATPVVSSDRLLQAAQIRACLFAVAPAIEARLQDRLAPLARRGVVFRSIYAARDNAIVPHA
jgi:SAM-dependent methyltransferase